MSYYDKLSSRELKEQYQELQKQYAEKKSNGLKLDLSRGKPDVDQLKLSYPMLDTINSTSHILAEEGSDVTNYGCPMGIPEARRMMAELLEIAPEQVYVGGNSSLNLMHDCIGVAYLHGVGKNSPWCKQSKVKFLCPSPGYDRHFAVTEHFGIELVAVPMTSAGPNMDIVEQLVKEDSTIKGIWCIPKYSNPTGITYSDDTVRRLASMQTAADDFLIFWDNAYAVHHLYPDQPDKLLNIMDEVEIAKNPNRALCFTSTSKITFPGAGISALGSSTENIKYFSSHFALQTIGYDKINQLRHVRFFNKNYTIETHMRAHSELLLPKFNAVLSTLKDELEALNIAKWEKPRGGYFISLDVMPNCAKRALELCKEAGVTMTTAGATFPYGKDPDDSNIRIAPTYAKIDEVFSAAKLLCLCVKLASAEQVIKSSL